MRRSTKKDLWFDDFSSRGVLVFFVFRANYCSRSYIYQKIFCVWRTIKHLYGLSSDANIGQAQTKTNNNIIKFCSDWVWSFLWKQTRKSYFQEHSLYSFLQALKGPKIRFSHEWRNAYTKLATVGWTWSCWAFLRLIILRGLPETK